MEGLKGVNSNGIAMALAELKLTRFWEKWDSGLRLITFVEERSAFRAVGFFAVGKVEGLGCPVTGYEQTSVHDRNRKGGSADSSTENNRELRPNFV